MMRGVEELKVKFKGVKCKFGKNRIRVVVDMMCCHDCSRHIPNIIIIYREIYDITNNT